MARNLLANDLTVENIDDADFTNEVDPIDTLRRIGKQWKGLRLKCTCRSNHACCVCEIDYLLEEAFKLPECPTNRSDNPAAKGKLNYENRR